MSICTKFFPLQDKIRFPFSTRSIGKNICSEAKVENIPEFISLYKKLEKFAKSAKNANLLDFFEEFIRESGFLESLIARTDSVEKLAKLDSLFNQMKDLIATHKDYRLHDFIEYLDILEKHNVIVRTKGSSLSVSAVHLMTAHKSKGLEFDHVYITNLVDGHWGNKREMRKFKLPMYENHLAEFDAIDDERRLLYVALTRARKEITLTYAKESEDGRPQMPSQFLTEISVELIKSHDTKTIEERYEENKTANFCQYKMERMI